MKTKMYAGIMLCTLALATSCSNEEATMENTNPGSFALEATMGTATTRTTVTKDYHVNWSAGDKIYVYGNNVYASLTLDGEGGSDTGTFKGMLKGDGEETDLQYALYPVPTVSGTNYTISLPDTYNYGDASNSPMYAVFGTDKTKLAFRHLCGMMRITLKNIPAEGAKTLTLTSENGNIAGDASVTETNGTLALAAPTGGKQTVSIQIPDGTPANATDALVFDIPLPAGKYEQGLKLGLSKDGNKLVDEKTINNLEIVAGEITVMSTLRIIDLNIEGTTPSFVEAKHVGTADDLKTAISSGEPYITLTEDIEINGDLSFSKTEPATIDLNEKTLTLIPSSSQNIASGNVTFENGNIKDESTSTPGVNNPSLFNVEAGGSITLNHVTLNAPNGTALFPRGDAAAVTVRNSTIKAKTMGVTTNANNADNYDVIITLENSTITANSPVLVNVPCNMTIMNCNITGDMHGVVVRGGTATIENSDITLAASFDSEEKAKGMADYFVSSYWGQGNTLNLAAITLGNKHATSYQYPTNVTLKNTKTHVTGDYASLFPNMYIYANPGENLGVTLTYDEQCDFTNGGKGIVYGTTQNVTVNGETPEAATE